MKRQVDPLQPAHRDDEPLRAPLDHIVDFGRALLVVSIVAVLGLVALAVTLSDIPGVRP